MRPKKVQTALTGFSAALLLMGTVPSAYGASPVQVKPRDQIGSVQWWDAQEHRRLTSKGCPKGFVIETAGGRVVPGPPAVAELGNDTVYDLGSTVRVAWRGGSTRVVNEGAPFCVRDWSTPITSPQDLATLSFAPARRVKTPLAIPQPPLATCTPAERPAEFAISAVKFEPGQEGQRLQLPPDRTLTWSEGSAAAGHGVYTVTLRIAGGSGIMTVSGFTRTVPGRIDERTWTIPLAPDRTSTIDLAIARYSLGAFSLTVGPLPRGAALSVDCGQQYVPALFRGRWDVPVLTSYDLTALRVENRGSPRAGFDDWQPTPAEQ